MLVASIESIRNASIHDSMCRSMVECILDDCVEVNS